MKHTEQSKTFKPLHSIRPHKLAAGITARAVEGQRLSMAVVDLDPNAVLPEHHHDNEQLGFVIAGSITMRIGTEKRVLYPGDTYAIPSHVPHDAATGPDGATVADVFAPVREDWKKLDRLDPTTPRWP
jgi:quercetin dioxygenase-like cupin family protein